MPQSYAPLIAGSGGIIAEMLDSVPTGEDIRVIGINSSRKMLLFDALTADETEAAIAAAIAAAIGEIEVGAAWGGITGTLSDQTDLQAALDAKLSSIAPLTLGSNLVEQRNGASGQRLRVYRGYTSATSGNWLEIDAATDLSMFAVPFTHDIASCVGSAGGATLPIRIGAKSGNGDFTPWLSFATNKNATFGGNVFSTYFGSASYTPCVIGVSGLPMITLGGSLESITFHAPVVFASSLLTTVRRDGVAFNVSNANTGSMVAYGITDGATLKWSMRCETDGRYAIYNNIAASHALAFSTTSHAAFAASVTVGVYTFATVPSASAYTGATIRISDRAQRQAYSDGTDWRFLADDVIIS